MIRTIGLTKLYRTEEIETTALDSVDFSVKAGEFLAVMGPSGCGKTTLLNILGMLDSPSKGEYHFFEHEVSGYSESQLAKIRKANIGFIFQSFNLVDDLTIFENVELPLLYLGYSQGKRKRIAEEALERMQMMHRRNHFPQQLSGGQQQRVAVARAVVVGPKVILADEPTGNLDSVNGKEVMGLMSNLHANGTTIIMVTHSEFCAEYAQRVVHLFDGVIVRNDGGRRDERL